MSKKRVTLSDVAKDAAVSRATASLVLRGSPLVAAQTRQQVLTSMQKLGYVYNRAAASLRTQRSQTVGLVMTDITNPFFAELTVGIEAHLDQANYTVLLTNTSENPVKQHRFLTAMQEYRVDGVLLCPANDTSEETIKLLQQWQLPVVLIARTLADPEADYVGPDNVLGAAMAVEHLIAQGHRRIAFVGGPARSSARQERLQGFQDGMSNYAVDLDPDLLITSPVSRNGGYTAIQTLLQSIPSQARPTAAVCYNDVVAFGVMLGLQAAGHQPGIDFAVVGFDDVADAALWQPTLTTISITPRQIGQAAARLLLERINDQAGPRQRVILPPTLIVRESCDANVT